MIMTSAVVSFSSAASSANSRSKASTSPNPSTSTIATTATMTSTNNKSESVAAKFTVSTRRSTSGFAMVKACPQGDSVLLLGCASAVSEIGPEKSLTLSGITAPKFARGKNAKDEPYAFQSREFLRQRLVGQQVKFQVTHVSEAGREYGFLLLQGENVAMMMVKAGWARVKDGAIDKQGNVRVEFTELVAAQQEAQQAKRGLWSATTDSQRHVRKIEWNPDVMKLVEKYKNQPLPAIVDKVIDGSTLRVELTSLHTEPLHHTMLQLCLAGVQCERTPLPLSVLQSQYEARVMADAAVAESEERPTHEEEAKPFAREAQHFTETRLLNRSVTVVLQGIDKAKSVYGSIQFSKGNITLKLLELGYGKYVAWSAALTAEADLYSKVAVAAKSKRLRVWANYQENANEMAVGTQYEAKVVYVQSGDNLVLLNSNNVENRVSLASIRCPRLGRRGERDEAFAQQAKELVRSRLIGHRARVVVEYVRNAPNAADNEEVRQYVTLFINKQNITEQLVSAGFASVIRHGRDEPRSQFYDAYVQAEQQAMQKQQGMHSKKQTPVPRIVDLTERSRVKATDNEDGEDKTSAAAGKNKSLSAKSKQFFNQLSRESQVPAIVEFCFSGSRFKLFFPRESVLSAFSLSAIRTPLRTEKDSKWAVKALEFVKNRLIQRDVKVQVEAQDKNDTVIGTLFYTHNNRLQNLAVQLVEEGLATVFNRAAEHSEYKDELFAAQQKAKAVKKGLWVDYVEPVVQPSEEGDEAVAVGNAEFINIRVTEIESCQDFYVQMVDDKQVSVVEEAMSNFKDTAADLEPFHPSKQDIIGSVVCAGLFTDEQWYRVKVEGMVSGGEYRVKFIDYGNHSILDAEHLRALPESLAKVPPLAHHATLAGLKAPQSEDYSDEAALEFNALVWDQQLLAKVEHQDRPSKLLHLTLLQESSPVSINKQLLDIGFARINRRVPAKLKALLEELQPHEDSAKKNRYNIFEYGDVDEEEEERELDRPSRR